MEIGLQALGTGPGAERTVIDAVAAAAERAGFATIWAGDVHDDRTPDNTRLDPFITLSFAAGATNTIELAVAVSPIPERNPAVVANQAESLNRLTGGRFILGLQVGRDRPAGDRHTYRAGDYATAMRDAERVATPAGSRRRRVPLLLGSTDDDGLQKVVTCADGWYGVGLDDVEEAARCTSTLRRLCRKAGRDFGELRLVVSLRDPQPTDAARLASVGIDQLVLSATPPADPIVAESWVAGLARDWLSSRY